MNDLPLVSIVIPTRNRPALLKRAVDSVLAQSYPDWELIIVNDGGQDIANVLSDTRGGLDARIRLLQHPFSMGPGAARNTALRVARGKYAFYLDDDDIYLPDHVSGLVNFLEENELDMAFSRGMLVYEDASGKEVERSDYYVQLDIFEEFLYVTNAIPLIGIAHKLDSLKRTGFFDEQLTSFEDWDLILRFVKTENCSELPVTSYEIRQRVDDADSVSKRNLADHIANYRTIYQRHPVDSGELNAAREEVLASLENATVTHPDHPDVESRQALPDDTPLNTQFDLQGMLSPDEIRDRYAMDIGKADYLTVLKQFAEDVLANNLAEQVITRYVDYLTENSRYVDGHVQLGYLLNAMGEKDTARHAFSNALSLEPGRQDAALFKAGIVAEAGERANALQLLEVIHPDRGFNQVVLYEVVKLYSSLAAADEAIAYAESVVSRHDGAIPLVLNHLGNLYYRKNDLHKARECYQRAVEQDANFTDANTNLSLVKTLLSGNKAPLFLVLPRGENYGWGVCSENLRRELPAKTGVFNLEYENWSENGNKTLPGPVFTSIGAESLDLIYPVKGVKNIGYTFFERDLTPQAKPNAAFFDLVLAGSSWAVDQLKAHGIHNTDVLVQGIDDKKFYPVEVTDHKGFFVFSGGKFELRKGQDIVLKAIGILQKKYSDLFLVNAWVNYWPQSMYTMSYSPHIRYEYRGDDWQGIMHHLYALNGIDPEKVITCDIVPHEELRNLYARTDIGLFPNRSEGGTNLVLMEYMACGKPVIASHCTGHKDIVNAANSLLLEKPGTKEYLDDHGQHFATWDEPDLEEVVDRIEYAYLHRDEIRQLGRQAGEDLRNFTWEKMAANLVDTLHKWSLLD